MKKYLYEKGDKLEEIAKQVISEHEELNTLVENNIEIAYIRSSQEKRRGRNRLVFADTRKVTDVYSYFCPFDFIMTFYMPNVELLDGNQLKILIWHELKHCGIDNKGNTYIINHDIEDFKDIIQKHGLSWSDAN